MENPYQTPAADVIAAPATHTAWAFKNPTWLTWVCRACLVAGAFTLLPNRYLGGLLWHGLLGL